MSSYVCQRTHVSCLQLCSDLIFKSSEAVGTHFHSGKATLFPLLVSLLVVRSPLSMCCGHPGLLLWILACLLNFTNGRLFTFPSDQGPVLQSQFNTPRVYFFRYLASLSLKTAVTVSGHMMVVINSVSQPWGLPEHIHTNDQSQKSLLTAEQQTQTKSKLWY